VGFGCNKPPHNTPLKIMEADTIKIVGFHAHIYFDTDRRDAAARVREGLARFEVQLGHGGMINPLSHTPKRCIKLLFYRNSLAMSFPG
jgi:aromatic ring-cleaving dioxygenase